MILHQDKEAFEFIVDEVAQKHSVRRDVLEKDYYVTLMLHELTKLEHQGYAYFKGGTALYKALRSVRRFSEDIDLTVYIEDCPSPSQAKKRLENAVLKFVSMQKGDTLENHRGSITCEYYYPSIYELDILDSLQRFGKVKVEATSFTVSEPTDRIEIAPHLYELANESRRTVLSGTYGVAPFEIETISLERIFIDKVFAAQFYFEREEFSDVAKHVYDLTVLLGDEKIKVFLKNKKRILEMVALKRKEELNRKGGIDANKKIIDFEYLKGLQDNRAFSDKFSDMQKIYVFNKRDILSETEAFEAIRELSKIMNIE